MWRHLFKLSIKEVSSVIAFILCVYAYLIYVGVIQAVSIGAILIGVISGTIKCSFIYIILRSIYRFIKSIIFEWTGRD